MGLRDMIKKGPLGGRGKRALKRMLGREDTPEPAPSPAPARAPSVPTPAPGPRASAPAGPAARPAPARSPAPAAAPNALPPEEKAAEAVGDTWVQVARSAEVPVNRVVKIKALNTEYALAHVEGGFHGLAAGFPEDGTPTVKGTLEGTTLTHPETGSKYDITSGAALGEGDAFSRPSIRVNDGYVFVKVN